MLNTGWGFIKSGSWPQVYYWLWESHLTSCFLLLWSKTEVRKCSISPGGCNLMSQKTGILLVLQNWCKPLAKGHVSYFTDEPPLPPSLTHAHPLNMLRSSQKVIHPSLPLWEAEAPLQQRLESALSLCSLGTRTGKVKWLQLLPSCLRMTGKVSGLGGMGAKWLYYIRSRQFTREREHWTRPLEVDFSSLDSSIKAETRLFVFFFTVYPTVGTVPDTK